MTFLLQRCRRTIGVEKGFQDIHYITAPTIINPLFWDKTGFSGVFRETGINGLPEGDTALGICRSPCHLVPKLPFGSALPQSSASLATPPKQSFGEGVPKLELGNK
jgi:hypothetical protein